MCIPVLGKQYLKNRWGIFFQTLHICFNLSHQIYCYDNGSKPAKKWKKLVKSGKKGDTKWQKNMMKMDYMWQNG